jgi:hypothetical protein
VTLSFLVESSKTYVAFFFESHCPLLFWTTNNLAWMTIIESHHVLIFGLGKKIVMIRFLFLFFYPCLVYFTSSHLDYNQDN